MLRIWSGPNILLFGKELNKSFVHNQQNKYLTLKCLGQEKKNNNIYSNI